MHSIGFDNTRGHDMPGGSARTATEATPLQVALRYRWRIFGAALAATVVGAALLPLLPRWYVSTASVVVDSRQLRITSAENLLSTQTLDADLLRTYMEQLRSVHISRTVVEQLNLQDVPEICAGAQPSISIWERLVTLFESVRAGGGGAGAADTAPCSTTVEAAAKYLRTMISAYNDGHSYVIRISAGARDPELAAEIANGFASTYVDQRRHERQRVAEQVSVFLQSQLVELRAEMLTAASAVEEHRLRFHLTTVRGETLPAQNLAELNTQLNQATAELTQKQSTLSNLQELVRSGGDAETSATALNSLLIQRLLERHGQLVGALAEQRAHLGARHPDILAGNAQVERLKQQIRAEASKAVAAVAGEVEALTARRDTVAAAVRNSQQRVAEIAHADIRLRALDRDANIARGLYEAMATRLRQIAAEQGLQHGDAYLAVEARPAEFPSFPRPRMMLTGVFFSMLGAGAGVAFATTMLSRIFRDPADVEEQTGLRVLGAFPKPPRGILPHDVVVDRPLSLEAEAVHSIVSSLVGTRREDEAPLGKAVMITSALPGDGKTSFSLALGRSAARAGLSAVVVDADLRRGALRDLIPPAHGQTLSTQFDTAGRDATLPFLPPVKDPRSGVLILPLEGPVSNPHEILGSARLLRVLARLRSEFDLVILDTPPLLAVSDALNLALAVDDVLVMMTLRQTPRTAVMGALRALHRAGVHVTGVVISKVDLTRRIGGGKDRPYPYEAPFKRTALAQGAMPRGPS